MAQESTIDEQRILDDVKLPFVFMPSIEGGDAVQWVRSNRQLVLDLMVKHGAVLFRGFPISNPQLFAEFVEALGLENLPYIGGAAVRTSVVGDRVFTANESPASEVIPFHHEMAQVPKYPSKIFFYCETPPLQGGETPILLSHRVCHRLQEKHPEFMKKLTEKGVKYVRIIPENDDATSAIGRGWKSTYQTQNREVAEERLKQLGSTWEWLPDGNLKTVTAVLPAIKTNPNTQQPIFFNSIVAAYTGWRDSRNIPEKAVLFGDDTELDAEAMASAVQIMNEEKVAFKWHQYDVVCIDNHACMHSRNPFIPPRRILASLAI